MKRLWFITNPASGSTSGAKAAAIEAVFADRGLALAGRSHFPADPLPSDAALDAAGVDTVVLFAGDGTINASVCALGAWNGRILILPGGTMNLLAKRLHGPTEPAAIIAAAHDHGAAIALPYVEAGAHRALVGMIVGPAASWVRARELVRARRLRGLVRAVGAAWRRTFSRSIRVVGVPGFDRRAQAIFVRPAPDPADDAGQSIKDRSNLGRLDVVAIDARDWRAIMGLGWKWLTGDWVEATQVSRHRASRFNVGGAKPVLALFDGEPVMLDPATPITGGETARQFITTIDHFPALPAAAGPATGEPSDRGPPAGAAGSANPGAKQ